MKQTNVQKKPNENNRCRNLHVCLWDMTYAKGHKATKAKQDAQERGELQAWWGSQQGPSAALLPPTMWWAPPHFTRCLNAALTSVFIIIPFQAAAAIQRDCKLRLKRFSCTVRAVLLVFVFSETRCALWYDSRCFSLNISNTNLSHWEQRHYK